VDVRLINPFIAATRSVFRVMGGSVVSPGQPRACTKLPIGPKTLNAVVTMEGGATGAVVLVFPARVVLRVATAFGGGNPSEADARDAVGEVANMVAGNAKRALGSRLVRISIPRLGRGDRSVEDVASLTAWICVPFTAPFGSFSLAASVATTEAVTAADLPHANEVEPGADIDFVALAATVACETQPLAVQ